MRILHVARTNNVPSFGRHSSLGCFLGVRRTKVAFSGHFQLHGVLGFLEGMIVFLPCFKHIFRHTFINRIRILDWNGKNEYLNLVKACLFMTVFWWCHDCTVLGVYLFRQYLNLIRKNISCSVPSSKKRPIKVNFYSKVCLIFYNHNFN